jgi:hypothetical protein
MSGKTDDGSNAWEAARQPAPTTMKMFRAVLVPLLLLNSCVFESPFASEAVIPVDPGLLGRWEMVSGDGDKPPARMLVLQHAPDEYTVGYSLGEKAMYFRAFAVGIAGEEYLQIQLIGTAEGPVKPGDRKYHLLKVAVDGDKMEMRTINPEALGKDLAGTERMREALIANKNRPGLFTEPEVFRKIR